MRPFRKSGKIEVFVLSFIVTVCFLKTQFDAINWLAIFVWQLFENTNCLLRTLLDRWDWCIVCQLFVCLCSLYFSWEHWLGVSDSLIVLFLSWFLASISLQPTVTKLSLGWNTDTEENYSAWISRPGQASFSSTSVQLYCCGSRRCWSWLLFDLTV